MYNQISEKKKSANAASELRAQADMLQLEIADILLRFLPLLLHLLLFDSKSANLRQHKLENIVKEGEEAKKGIVELEKELSLKRKLLQDAMKDMAAAQVLKNKLKQKQDEQETKMNIVSDPALRSLLLKQIPKLLVTPPTSQEISVSFSGPLGHRFMQHFSDYVCVESASLYPYRPEINKFDGDPIADRQILFPSTVSTE
jgi:chromosome segregation ATPase